MSVETAFRVVGTFVYALVLLRFISRRSSGNLSLFETLLVGVWGSVVGDPMLNHDSPLVRGFVVTTAVILAMRATVYMVSRSRRATDTGAGKACRVVQERRLDWDGIREVSYSREEVAKQLRLGGVSHPGEVEGA